jgi:glycosyltransferase involved in cell wall biosynthesis
MMQKKIKVLQVLSHLGGGGVETLLLDMQAKLPEHITFDYLVACPGSRDKEAQARGSTVHTPPPDMSHPIRWATHVGQLVREYHYDVVHFHRFAFSGAVLKAAKRAGAVGRVAHRHGMYSEETFLKKLLYFPYHWTINRGLLLQHSTHIIGCSSDALRLYMGPFATYPKCQVILNGIPIESFAKKIGATPKAELCQRYGISANVHVVGTFGRLEPVKNHEFLLRVFDHLAGTPSVLFIGGEGQLRTKLEQQRNQLDTRDRIFMPGHCANVPELLGNLFDCFVCPSKTEGFGISVVEAVAAGLHVVCSDVIPKDVTGTFSDRITALSLSAPLERWAEAIENAIQKRISPEQGLELVRHSSMTFQHFTDEMIKIYEDI